MVETRVSVVMPAYNARRTLRGSMLSALTQSHQDLELIVVDDASTDDGWHIVQDIAAADPRVVALRQRANQGVASARNAGLEAATGRYVAFLDSDDRWHHHKLRAQIERLSHGDAKVCYAAYRRVDEHGNELSVVRPPARVRHADMLKSNHIGNLTGIYDRALGDFRFRKVGHEDYAFWLQVVRAAGEAVRLQDPSPVADYLVRHDSLSAQKLRAAHWQWRIYREVEGMGLARAGWYFAHYAANASRKRR